MKRQIVDPIDVALREDIGEGDITTDFFVSKDQEATARIIVRERAILAGAETTAEVFRRVDSKIQITSSRTDGSEVHADESVMELRGAARSILKAERVALNFLQRLSGIATMTHKFVEAAASKHVRILDTRKTTPGLRVLERAAVVAGGGQNHRFGLFDMVVLNDNHLATSAGFDAFAKALHKFHEVRPNVRIEVEADRHRDRLGGEGAKLRIGEAAFLAAELARRDIGRGERSRFDRPLVDALLDGLRRWVWVGHRVAHIVESLFVDRHGVDVVLAVIVGVAEGDEHLPGPAELCRRLDRRAAEP